MEPYMEILLRILERDDFSISASDRSFQGKQLVDLECYHAILKIRNILEDESLKDSDCFMQIEEVLSVLEDTGVMCKYRHDFS